MAKTIQVVLDLKNSKFVQGLKGEQAQIEQFKGVASTMNTVLMGGIAGIGVSKIVGFAKTAVDAYAQQQQAEEKLAAGLRILGDASQSTMQDMKGFASQMQRVTVHGDEAVLEIMGLGASLGKLSGKELKDATQAAIGLSDAFGIDLNASMLLVAKAAQGNFSALSRYGITLNETATAGEKFNQVMEIGIKNFDISKSLAGTASGQIDQMKNAWSDMSEVVGEGIAKAFTKATTAMFGGAEGMMAFTDANKTLISGNIEEGILSLASSMSYLVGILEKMGAIMTPITSGFKAITGISALQAGLGTSLRRPWEFFGNWGSQLKQDFDIPGAWSRGTAATAAGSRLASAGAAAYGARIGSDLATRDVFLAAQRESERIKNMGAIKQKG
ncbi:MAG TPA: hypothetical protein VM223_22470 [Planctomycetota bacterium]|nr:hypothetical protein [Planctomycetota bacterium]